jgi:hypothetical protein
MNSLHVTEETETPQAIVDQINDLPLSEKIALNPESYDFSDIADPEPSMSRKMQVTLSDMLGGAIRVVNKEGKRFRLISPKLRQELEIGDILSAVPADAPSSAHGKAQAQAVAVLMEKQEGGGNWIGATLDDLLNTFRMSEVVELFNLAWNDGEGEQGSNPLATP